MLEQLESWDQALFLWLNGLHNPVMDEVMKVITSQWAFVPIYLIVLVVVGLKYGIKRTFIVLPAVGLLILLTDQISYQVFKEGIARYRPCHNELIGDMVRVLVGCGGKYGFVSGHSTNSFGIALFSGLLLGNRRWLWILLSWAALVAYSRIYVGVHYPSDIIGGMLLGLFLGYLVFRLYRWVEGRLNLSST